MKAIGYTRCSTQEQSDSGLGLDAQAERIRAYAVLKGLELVEIITDAGVSGGKPLASRDGGQRLLKALKARRARGVVFLKLDRGFRNAGDCLATVEEWDRKGVALHVVDLGGNAIDTQSAAGRFMLVVLAGAAEMERNLTRERTRSALAVKKANGQRVGTIPYGWSLADDGKTLESVRSEQQVLADMKAMRADGKTFQAIANELTERSILTKQGRTTWSGEAVRMILKRAGVKRGRPAT